MNEKKYFKLGELPNCTIKNCPGNHVLEATEKEYLAYIEAITAAKILIDSWKGKGND